MDKAAFRLESYQFTKASLDFNIPDDATLGIDITPRGAYVQDCGTFELSFSVKVLCEETRSEVVSVTCKAKFIFENPVALDEIPDFFYPNSLAIIFPYVRAFVSTITLQANVHPVVLPTVNLMGLTETLRNNTKAAEV